MDHSRSDLGSIAHNEWGGAITFGMPGVEGANFRGLATLTVEVDGSGYSEEFPVSTENSFMDAIDGMTAAHGRIMARAGKEIVGYERVIL